MKRLVVALLLAGMTLGTMPQAMAADWNYSHGSYYPVQQSPQRDYPILKKVLIGGALIGIGVAAARMTAPRYDSHYSGHGYHGGSRHGHHHDRDHHGHHDRNRHGHHDRDHHGHRGHHHDRDHHGHNHHRR